MANLENNNEKENKNSIGKNIGKSVQKRVDEVKDTVKGARELAEDAISRPKETAGEFIDQASKDVVSIRWWAKLLLVLFWSVLSIVGIFLIAINLSVTKDWIAHKVMEQLNQDLKAQIYFKKVDVNYFGDVTIHELSAKDYKGYPFLKAEKLYAASDWFSIISNSRNIRFQSMALDHLDLKVITYKNDSISNFVRFIDLFDDGKPSTHKTPFKLKTRIQITNSKVSIVNQNSPGEEGKWLDATNVNLTAPEFFVVGPNISAQINNFTFETKRFGKVHKMETFTTNLSLTKKFLQLEDLTLNTDHTLLQGRLKFNLNNGKWEDFSNKVPWEMNLISGSQISGYDISYFMPRWDNYTPVNISGELQGPLNSFNLNHFALGNGKVNIFTKEMKVQNILEHQFKIQTGNLSTDFTYKDLKAMMPTFIAEKMKNFADDFGRLKYNGSASLTPQQVYISSASLITGIGQAKIKEFYLTDYSETNPKYNGFAELSNFNTSIITKSKEVGLVSGSFNVKGQGFDVNTLSLQTQSNVSSIEILGKQLHQIVLNGNLDHKQYTGLVSINDPQAKATVSGKIDFRTSRILADIKADVEALNISYFTGDQGKQSFTGSVEGKIAMSTLNDMNLDLHLNKVAFNNGTQSYHIPNGALKAFVENGNRTVSVDMPGAVTGKMSGKFNIADLGGMIQNSLNRILVGPPPRKLYKNQSFAIDFHIEQDLLHYFVPDLAVPHGAKIDGAYDGNTNNLVLNVQAEELLYLMAKKQQPNQDGQTLMAKNKDSLQVEQLTVHINTANSAEQIFARAERIKMDKNIFRDVTISGANPDGNILHLATDFKYGTSQEEAEDKMKEYQVNLNQSTNPQGDLVFRFEPTKATINNVLWQIDTDPSLDHSITYRKKSGDFLIKNLRIFSDDSSVLVQDATFKSADEFKMQGEVHHFQIAKIFQMLQPENENDISGVANGAISILKEKHHLTPLVNLTVEDIKMNKEDLGNFTFTVKDSSQPNVFEVDGRLASAGIIGNNKLHLTGTINTETTSPTLDISTELDDFDIGFAQQFVNSVFSKMRGKATGVLKIGGTFDDIDYSGDIALKGFGMKLDFTGVDYAFDDTVISLSKGLAILNDIGIKDGRNNSKGSISGLIQFDTLSSMAVDLVLRADNLMVLNTLQKDFDLFWGTVYARGTLNISGPVTGLNLESDPQNPLKALNNSVFTFNSNSSSTVEEFKMLRFLKREEGGQIAVEEKKKTGANMNVDLIAAVDKGTMVNVLVGDEVGGISVRGTSDRLRFKMSRTGNIEMLGNYVVDNGTYISKAILERTFQIQKGSSIQWDGDAMTPELNITATYERTVSNANQYLQMSNIPPIDIMLVAKITKKLNNPTVDFNVEAPEASSQLKEALAEKMNDRDQRILQFSSIILMNSFNVSNAGLGGLNVGSLGANMGYGMLFKQLGAVFNSLSNEFQLDLDYISGDPGSNTGDRANANVSFMLSPRVKLKTGFGIPISKSENVNNQFLTGEGTVEYDVSSQKDGSMVLRAYSKPSNIGLLPGMGNMNANQTYGVGVVYSKSFNSLFKTKKRRIKDKYNAMNTKRDSIRNDSIK